MGNRTYGAVAIRQFAFSVRRGLVVVAIISITSNILLLALPIYSLQIFDRVLLSRSLDTLWVLTVGVVIAMLAAAMLEGLRGQLLARVANRLILAFEQPLFDAVLHHARTTGDTSLQAMRDAATLRNFISTPQGVVALIDAPLVPIYLAVVSVLHPWLGVAMTIGMVALLAIAWLGEVLTMPGSRLAFDRAQDAQRCMEDLARGSEAIAAHGMDEAGFRHWQVRQHEALSLGSMATTRTNLASSLAKGVRLMINVALTGVGAYLALADEITAGAMIAANILVSRGLAPMELLIGAGRQLLGARLALGRIQKMLDHGQQSKTTRLPNVRGDVEVERAIYIPPGTELPTIKGVSMHLAAGTFLGLVGPSAAGKSSLAKLICGVWTARSGVVRLDGADVQSWDRGEFGKSCGYMPQDVQLIEGSVRDNICRFGEASDEEVIAAAQAAGVHELVVRLPKGYHTEVGPGGSFLSAGQRQRVGLARAMFGNPRLIVLDEPNANLDGEGEQALAESLVRAKERGATLIVISHRPSLLSMCDMLAVLVDGQFQHFGQRNEVLKRIQPQPVAVERNVA